MEIRAGEFVGNLTVKHQGDSEPSYDALNLFLIQLSELAYGSAKYEESIGNRHTAKREMSLSKEFLKSAETATPV
jgi:hypothetical protein